MSTRNVVMFVLNLAVIIAVIGIAGCTAVDDGRMPITTSSEEARENYLQGRDLFEKLRAQESIQYFKHAIAADPDFALAHLNLAFVQPNAKGFFESLDKARALVDQVSEAERLWILGVEAGTNADPMGQREFFQQLVTVCPNDERAHNLLGNNYFGQQEYASAIEQYNKALEINPQFSPPFNQLGYAYRFLEEYDNAEQAFSRYVELIPDDPNPHDSYAELLMKIGRYDESIEEYRKALTINSNFPASYAGIASNLVYQDKHAEARTQLEELLENAKNDGQRRFAHFAIAASYVDEGNSDQALSELDKQFALAEKINDAAAMAGDLNLMGNVLLEEGKIDDAQAMYDRSVGIMEQSGLATDVIGNAKRFYLYNSARVAVMKKDLETAKTKAEEYSEQVEILGNPLQIKLSHELNGIIALAEEDYSTAISELQQANQQRPYNLYRLAHAYAATGDDAGAREMCTKAAKFNQPIFFNYAFIRKDAEKMLASL